MPRVSNSSLRSDSISRVLRFATARRSFEVSQHGVTAKAGFLEQLIESLSGLGSTTRLGRSPFLGSDRLCLGFAPLIVGPPHGNQAGLQRPQREGNLFEIQIGRVRLLDGTNRYDVGDELLRRRTASFNLLCELTTSLGLRSEITQQPQHPMHALGLI